MDHLTPIMLRLTVRLISQKRLALAASSYFLWSLAHNNNNNILIINIKLMIKILRAVKNVRGVLKR